PDAEALNTGIAVNNQPSAPAAPLPVGGDVKQAKLISSVPPVYPTLAKNQHVSGNVTVDALIDASGRVTTMKVVSGPTLLQQAAMDALKQWKYQPASLDGKPVAMHLTVTVQFRLQYCFSPLVHLPHWCAFAFEWRFFSTASLAGCRAGSYTGGPANWRFLRWGRPLVLTFLGLSIAPVSL